MHTVATVHTGLAKGKQGLIDPVELPYLRVANVQDGHFNLEEIKTIQVERSAIARYSLQPGDVLMTEGGDFDKLGRGAVWQAPIAPCLHQNHVFAVRPSSGILDSTFLAALSSSRYGRTYFESCAKRSTNLASINSSQLKDFPVLLPSYTEQLCIAHVLNVWDDAIVTIEKLLANLRKQKQALIGCVLMPVPLSNAKRTVGAAFPSSVQPGIPHLPPAPKGWVKTPLGTHLKEVIRPVSLDPTLNYRLVTVRRSRGGVDERCELPGAEIKTPTQFYVHEGDFLISKRQIVHGACGIVPPELDGAIVSNEYAVLNTHGDLDSRFLRYLSETTYFQQTCFHSSIGVHIEKMLFRLDKWLKWPINLPPLDEQLRIVAILDAASQEETTIQKQLDLLREEKRALMADLLTGKRRVRMPDTTAEPEAA
nr:restriction endonuclease subunit S [Herbaspirillum rubrisubalbicans]